MFERKKKSNEWDYVKDQKEEQEKEEEYIVTSEKKFRARTLIITAVLCIAVVALGILYMNKIIETSNAETVDNSAALDISAAESTAKNDNISSTEIEPVIITTAGSVYAPEITTAMTSAAQVTSDGSSESNSDFTATAFADKSGLTVEWKYTNSRYEGRLVSIYMTDGVTSYVPAGQGIPISAGKFTTSADNAEKAVGVYITLVNDNNDVLLERTITVDNRTYQPEVTYSDDIDIGELFR